jgi:tetratricopeptide (TPR) repeat protein
VDCHTQHLRLAKQMGNRVEEARAYSNLGSSHHFRRNFERALAFHEHVLRIALKLKDRSVEARAYAGLGHAARCMGDYTQARRWHERQLDSALATRDRVAEGRACSNLGIVYQLLGDHDAALKLHQVRKNCVYHLFHCSNLMENEIPSRILQKKCRRSKLMITVNIEKWCKF